MLALGHDEEVGGAGSLSIARSLRQRGVRLEWVLDEGLVVTQGIIPGASTPVALVGIAEKGLAKIELVAEAPGGHASMPPTRTAPGRLGEALGRLEAAPMPARVDGAARAMLERIAPDMPVAQRLALANLWLLEPLVRRQLTRQASTNALLRSTMAVTVLEGGERANVLVQRARAVLDVRVHPRDSIGSIVAHIARVVGDLGVVARVIDGPFTGEPSPVAATDATGYRVVEQSVRAALPDAIVAPGLLMAGTDARHYLSLADDVYRFMPARLGRKDLERIHGTDERLALTNLEEYVRFYGEVLRRAGE
jgi:carboxypeptidase PM20D1